MWLVVVDAAWFGRTVLWSAIFLAADERMPVAGGREGVDAGASKRLCHGACVGFGSVMDPMQVRESQDDADQFVLPGRHGSRGACWSCTQCRLD